MRYLYKGFIDDGNGPKTTEKELKTYDDVCEHVVAEILDGNAEHISVHDRERDIIIKLPRILKSFFVLRGLSV